ncbi:MAG TPA: condensation domain-containing protein, partial [Vicinamibacteria bacterium]|nr:condensation domain-containing protein [Vicinamibacteria bacterium]
RVICSGEALSYELQEQFFSRVTAQLHNLYGPTEAAVDVTFWACRPGDVRGVVPIGRPVANTQAYVLDEGMQPVPIGVVGELYLGGVQVGRGYFKRPDLTAERFVPDPFSAEGGGRLYRTGDLARHGADGAIEFLGRMDQQVKVRGFRIELGEIESVLEQHPDVKAAAVVVREDHPADQRLVAFVTPRGESGIQAGELRTHLKAKLPSYMVPSVFVELKTLPLSPNGKVDRRALPAPEAVGVERSRALVAPRTPVEAGVAEIWAQILRTERVGVHDSFFELGGHSLLVTQLVARLIKTFGVDVQLRTVFEAPTVAQLSVAIAAARRAAAVPPLGGVSRHGELAQSFAQQRLWFIEQLEPGNSVYNISAALGLDGELDKEALRRSLEAIVSRHESLRTTFTSVEGRPLQVVAPVSSLPLTELDLRGLPDREREARRLAEKEAARSFDLGRGPLLRAKLLRLAEREYVLLLTVHHIVFDGWSMGIFTRELTALYEAHLSGAPPPLGELAVQYADFAAWQREWLQGEILADQVGYWRQQLEGLQALEIPTDHPRLGVQTFNGAWKHRTIPVLRELKELSQREGVTLFMTLLAAFQTLLHRYTGAEDVAVGSPIANRRRPEFEDLIGLFVNSLVLRTDAGGDPTFRELLARVKQVALGAYDHQDVPFEKLVEEVGGQRDLARNPLFQVVLALHNTPDPDWRLSGLKVRLLETEATTTHFDLELHLHESTGGLAAWAVYNRDLFKASTIDRMLGHFQVLLQGIVARPEARLSELPLLTAGEVERARVEWNATGREYRREAGIHGLFEEQAGLRPEAIAVSFGGEELSYGELDGRSNRLARHLRGLGVGAEVRVGICVERSVEMVVGLLGILKAGGAYVPLDPSYPKERLAFMLEDSRVPVLVTQERMLEVLPEHGARVVCLDRDWGEIAGESEARLASV